jgi:hypothetical protein
MPKRYKWPNGSYHARPFGKAHRDDKPAKGKPKPKSSIRKVMLNKAPPGTYDIGLDRQEGALRRGLGDLLERLDPKTGTDSTRMSSDLLLGMQDIARQRGQYEQDYGTETSGVERGYQQSLQDLLSQEQGVRRSYGQLGNQQAQAFRASGLEGGATAQATAKRASNQAIDVAPITTARTRATEQRKLSLDDLLRQHNRAMDPKTGTFALQGGQLGLNYTRQSEDNASQLAIGRREANRQIKELATNRMQEYLAGGGRRDLKFNLKKPKQRAQYRKFKKLGVF